MQPAGLQAVFPLGWGQVQLMVTLGHGGFWQQAGPSQPRSPEPVPPLCSCKYR